MKQLRLKRFLWGSFLVAVLISWIAPLIIQAAMSKSKAYTEAHKIWGDFAHIQSGISWGETYDTYKIGFNAPGCDVKTNPVPFKPVGTGVNGWDPAFAAMPPNKGITLLVSGVLDFTIQSPAPEPPFPPPPSPSPGTVIPANTFLSTDGIFGTIVGAELWIDGKSFGGTQVITGTPWSATFRIDTKTYSNGPHVACALVTRADNGFNYTTPAMFMVNNP